jgi:hypothetical protein
MATEPKPLSARSATILGLIAAGHSYEQVLATDPELTYLDIFAAAREALEFAGRSDDKYTQRLAAVQQRYPRAYTPWSSEEERQLRQLVEAGCTIKKISAQLERQPSAIRSRMFRLGLQADASAPAGRGLHNVMEFYGRGGTSWDGSDAQEYINRQREEWDHRP